MNGSTTNRCVQVEWIPSCCILLAANKKIHLNPRSFVNPPTRRKKVIYFAVFPSRFFEDYHFAYEMSFKIACDLCSCFQELRISFSWLVTPVLHKERCKRSMCAEKDYRDFESHLSIQITIKGGVPPPLFFNSRSFKWASLHRLGFRVLLMSPNRERTFFFRVRTPPFFDRKEEEEALSKKLPKSCVDENDSARFITDF